METILEYHCASSEATVLIGQQKSPQEELSINKYSNISPSSLPLLSIKFDLNTYDQPCWDRSPHDHAKFQYHCPTRVDSLRLEYYPSVYMSYDLFYQAIREILENLGEEFENNYRDIIIHDVISKVHEIVDDESNKGREKLKVFVGVALAVEHLLDKNILSDDCVICLEEIGKKEDLTYTPCSHVFHKDCMATWLENRHSCPICRYDLS